MGMATKSLTVLGRGLQGALKNNCKMQERGMLSKQPKSNNCSQPGFLVLILGQTKHGSGEERRWLPSSRLP
jgi:hypothetical protein